MFYSQKPQTTPVVVRETPELARLRAEYVAVCTTAPAMQKDPPIVTNHRALTDFANLISDVRISFISAHAEKQSVLIGTQLVTLKDEKGTRREIGTFLIHLRRSVHPAVTFENLDRIVKMERKESGVTQTSCYSHPHIPHAPGGNFICTDQRESADLRARAGHMYEATVIALDALWSYTSNSAYCSASHWPIYQPRRNSHG